MHAPAFRPDGSVLDLAAPAPADIDFADMGGALSKIARFNGIYRCAAYSVAQHSVLGADALFAETGDAVLAGYFVLHDGHEYLLGDWTRPSVEAVTYHMLATVGADDSTAGLKRYVEQALRGAVKAAKSAIDAAVYKAAGTPDIALMPLYRRQVKDMDERMLRAEALALFGARAAPHLPAADRPPPRLSGAIKPWPAMKAEEEFGKRMARYLGIVVREEF